MSRARQPANLSPISFQRSNRWARRRDGDNKQPDNIRSAPLPTKMSANAEKTHSPSIQQAFKVSLFRRLRAYLFMTSMVYCCFFMDLLLAILWPIRYVHMKTSRNLSTLVLDYCLPGFLLPIAISLPIRVTGYDKVTDLKRKGDGLLFSNHASRIDWSVAAMLCHSGEHRARIGLVSEAYHSLLPIVGWFGVLCEHIFVWRSFKRDRQRILDNVQSFKETNTTRLIFLCIEGTLVDHGDFDKAVIEDCQLFCKDHGYKPFEYVLTPRYKGSQVLMAHTDSNLVQTHLAFRREKETSSFVAEPPADCVIATKALLDPARFVPDLFSVCCGGMSADAWNQVMSKIADDPEVAKKQLMDQYKYRDEVLCHFNENNAGTWPTEEKPILMPRNLVEKSISVSFQLLFGHLIGVFVFGLRSSWLVKTLVCMFVVVGSSHAIGECIGGASRESLPFETLLKSYVFAVRDKKVAQYFPSHAPKKSH